LNPKKLNKKRYIKLKTNERSFKFKILDTQKYPCVINTLKKGGFKESDKDSSKFNLLWTYTCKPEYIKDLTPYHRINHFPYSSNLGRKDLLWRNFLNMKKRYPDY